MKLSDDQWSGLRRAVADADQERFEQLATEVVRQSVREVLVLRSRHYDQGSDRDGRPFLACFR